MNINASPTYQISVEQKIRAKNFALQFKNGSPKLRDLLRQNCRIKMKQSRENAFSTARNASIEKRQLIHTIVKEELMNKEMENDIILHENILQEIFDNWENWQNEEYDKEFTTITQETENFNQVFCPVCLRNLLNLKENIISCNCGLRLYYPKSLNEFYGIILMNVKIHEERCLDKLTFFTEPKDGFNVLGLNAYCASCDYYSSILESI